MKIKFAFSALALLVVMTMATSAFAQAVFTVSSGIEPRGRMNGHAELAGGITLSRFSGSIGGAETGTAIIDYGVPITNALDTADPNAITVTICDTTTPREDQVTLGKNTITIEVIVTDGCMTLDDAIDVKGVRLSLAGSGQDSIAASITATGDVRLPSGSNQVTVINKVVDELVDDGVSADTLTLIRHTGVPEGDGEYFKLLIEENADDSFEMAALDLSFSGIQTGMTITLDAWVTTKEDLDDL